MSLAATVKAMEAAGCSAKQIADVVAKIDEERRAKSRAGNAERQRRFRERNANNGVTQRDEALCGVTSRDAVTETASREEYNTTRAQTVIPVGISNDIPPIDTPLPSEGPQGETKPEKRKSGTCLPDDWSPPEELFAYGSERGLSRSHTAEIIEGMRLWAKANRNQAKARKADWLAAMQGAIRRDAPKFNARAGPALNRGGVGKLLYESLETHGDLTNEKRETGHVDGSKKTGIAQDVRRLPFDGMPGRNDDSEHDRVVSGNPVGLLIGNSYRRM